MDCRKIFPNVTSPLTLQNEKTKLKQNNKKKS